jgi:hypothetical protein
MVVVMVLLCVMVMASVAISNEASAAVPAFADWYNVTAVSVGALPSFNFYFIFCTSNDTLWTGVRCYLVDSSNPATKAVLAAGLTGYASGGQLSLYIPGFSNASPPPANTFVSGVVAGSL